MPITLTSSVEFNSHLELLGIEPGMTVVMHSSLMSFGKLEGGTTLAYDTLIKRLGSTGTLIAPAFTFNLSQNEVYDPSSTPGRSTGVLSEYIRTQPLASRGDQPIHSYAAVGLSKQIVEQGESDISFGAGSIFEHFFEANTHWLMLGCPFERGCTYIHHAEALAGVPYREWLELPRKRRTNDGHSESVKVRYFATKSDFTGIWDPAQIEASISADDCCEVVSAPYGKSLLLETKVFHEIAMRHILENEMVLIR